MRKLKLIIVFICCIAFCNCSNRNNYVTAENPLDAGREFIDGCLKGEFKKAAFYMIDDTRNMELLETQEKNYNSKSKEEKRQYLEASIIINEDAAVNDSMHIINYQNSYDKTDRKVKVVLRNDNWQVDFKYTFDGNL